MFERHVRHQCAQRHGFQELLFRQPMALPRAAERMLDDPLQLGAGQAGRDALEADTVGHVLQAQHALRESAFHDEGHAPHETIALLGVPRLAFPELGLREKGPELLASR